MKNVLVTGVSSGIGNALSKILIKKSFRVWGIARRKNLLEGLKRQLHSDNFFYSVADVADENFWESLVRNLKRKKFTPDVIILNAAIHDNDLKAGVDLRKLRKIMEINFFSILKGIKLISETFQNKQQFITLSSTSAFKGNHEEGIGYAASKGALSIAFESLFQKYMNSRICFTTIFLGPVNGGMLRFTKVPPLTLTLDQVAEYILKSIKGKKPFYYYPKMVFVILSIMRMLPNVVFFRIWTWMQRPYTKDRSLN